MGAAGILRHETAAIREAVPGWPLMSPGEAAHVLGVTPATLARWAARGRLTAYPTPNGHRRYAEAEVRAAERGAGEMMRR